MRTTLIIDDHVLRQAKQRAAERQVTVSDLVNEALRESFRRPAPVAPPFALVTYGSPSHRVRHEPDQLNTLLEQEDSQRLRAR